MTTRDDEPEQASEYAQPLRRGLLIGAAVLALVLPPALYYAPHRAASPVASGHPSAAPHDRRAADLKGEPASNDVGRGDS